nr:hypothetical protein [Tanacetum cinerariifolium]
MMEGRGSSGLWWRSSRKRGKVVLSKPRLQSMTSGHISSGLDLTYALSTITTQQPSEGELDLLFEAMYDDYIGGQPSATRKLFRLLKNPKFVRRQRHLQQ